MFSNQLPPSSQRGHNIYNPSKSSSYKALSGHTWSIQYADGSGASGSVGTDTVTLGGTSVTQAVEIADTVSSALVSDGLDGLLGLSFNSINTGMLRCSCDIIFFYPNVPSSSLGCTKYIDVL